MSGDYKLSSHSEHKLERLVPLHQAQICYTFRADVKWNEKEIKRAGIALSEHCILFTKPAMFGSFKYLLIVYLLEIDGLELNDRNVIIDSEKFGCINIVSTKEMLYEFSKLIIRNYYMINGTIPNSDRIKFTVESPEHFPPLCPNLSPTQMFQFLYNYYCSYHDATYYHEVTQFFHTLITTENAIADFSRMPINLIDDSYSTAIDMLPIFEAMKYFPTIYGIQIKDVGRPDILTSVAQLVRKSSTIRLISLEQCNVSEGTDELAKAMVENDNLHLEYLDLSDNPITDLGALASALASNRGDLWYLDLSNCHMSAEALYLSLDSLIKNPNMWGMIHLDFRGAFVNNEATDLMIKYLETLDSNDCHTLRFLSFGKIKKRLADVLKALSIYKQPLETLLLKKCRFDDDAVRALVALCGQNESLYELDLAYTKLTPNQLSSLIRGIAQHSAAKKFELRLDGLKLNGGALKQFVSTLGDCVSFPWTFFSFENNEMTGKDIIALSDELARIKSLKGLSISCNMYYKDKDAEEALRRVANLPHLSQLSVAGDLTHFLREKVTTIFPTIKSRCFESFDFSFNKILDVGLSKLDELVTGNNYLHEIQIDGSKPSSVDILIQALDVIAGSRSLRKMRLPAEDVSRLMRHSVKKAHAEIFAKIGAKQRVVQDRLLKNTTGAGLHSEFMDQGIPELDELLDEMTYEVHMRLSRFDVLRHSCACVPFRLPLPYLSETDDQSRGVQEGQPTKVMELYRITDMADVGVEPPTESRGMHVRAMAIRKGEAAADIPGFENLDEELKPTRFEDEEV